MQSTSNATYQPRKVRYSAPSTREEFSKLTYSERMQLLQDRPELYQKFAAPAKKPWE